MPKLNKKAQAALVASALALGAGITATFEGNIGTYKDVAGVPTTCYGITDPAIVGSGKNYTEAQCMAFLNEHLGADAHYVLAHDNSPADMTAWRLWAFADFSYNLGRGTLTNASFWKKYQAGDVSGACTGLLAYVKAHTKKGFIVLTGLQNRRETERQKCMLQDDLISNNPAYDGWE